MRNVTGSVSVSLCVLLTGCVQISTGNWNVHSGENGNNSGANAGASNETTGATNGATNGATAAARCSYIAHRLSEDPDRVSRVSSETVQRWLGTLTVDFNQNCPPELTRVRPELADWERFPTQVQLRAYVHELLHRSGARRIPFDLLHDATHLRAHWIANELAAAGWNAHKLFILGSLYPRDQDQRFFRRNGPVFSGETTDYHDARRWTFHVAPVVIATVDGREGRSFPCPDNADRRCNLFVIDPSLRPHRLDGTTDDAVGLFTVSEWLTQVRPIETDPVQGIALEFTRRAQMLPRTLSSANDSSEVVVGESDACNAIPPAILQRREMAQSQRHHDLTAGFRMIERVFAGRSANEAYVDIEGLGEPLAVRSAPLRALLERAQRERHTVSVTYNSASDEVGNVRVEGTAAPTLCERVVAEPSVAERP